jgi:hypothetical protein
MKAYLKLVIIGVVGSFGVAAMTARATFEVSAAVNIHATADFYAPLARSGAWIEVGSYGRCWRPAGVAVDWRPYCSGHWVWTDCGWYWASDEPWGWACYHYGCWLYDPTYAWVWVPGIEWSPAWVTWRVGGGYIGWAPLAPRGARVAGPQFVFVQSARFQSPVRLSSVTVNNPKLLDRTRVVNNIKRETRSIGAARPQQVFVNEGPGLAVVQKASGRAITAVPIQEAAREARAPATFSRGAGQAKSTGKGAPQPKAVPYRNPADVQRNSPAKLQGPSANERVRTERPDVPQSAPPAASRERGTPPAAQREPPVRPQTPPARPPTPRAPDRMLRPPPPRALPGPAKPPVPAPMPSEGHGKGKDHEQEGGHHGKD